MKRLFSGIQPSGELHIGNYLGAIRSWVALQDTHDCVYAIVDYHAITQPFDPDELRPRILDAAIWLLACGIDPSRSTLFVQSDVPQHTELAWILASVTAMGDLGRMTQFKEKAAQHEHINAGLFTYPILQTADIALYKAEVVPVGADQVQHLELAREIVRRFNGRFGQVFPEPQPYLPGSGVGGAGVAGAGDPVGRVLGLDGGHKMSKSRGNTIPLGDDRDAVWSKLAPAVTDTQRKRLTDPGDPEVCNLFTLHRALSPPEVVADVAAGCRAASRGCFACKKILLAHYLEAIAPIRARARELAERPDAVREVLAAGAQRCRQIAAETLAEVRARMGLG